MADMTFTAGIDVSRYEKGLRQIEQMSKRSATAMERAAASGKSIDSSTRFSKAASAYGLVEKAASSAFRILGNGLDAYARQTSAGEAAAERWRRAVDRGYQAVGRLLVTSGAVDFATNAVNAFTEAYTGLGDAIARAVRGSEQIEEFDAAVRFAEEMDRRIKAQNASLEIQKRLKQSIARMTVTGYEGEKFDAGEQYKSRLKEINALTGIDDEEKSRLRQLAADERSATVQIALQREAVRLAGERERTMEEAARKQEDVSRRQASAIESVQRAAIEEQRANGFEAEADRMELLLDLESRRKQLAEAGLSADAQSRAELQLRIGAEARLAKINREDARAKREAAVREAEKLARFTVEGGDATLRSQVFGASRSSGAMNAPTAAAGAVQKVESRTLDEMSRMMKQLVNKVIDGKSVAVLG